jgi:hypothetical protein
VRDFVGIAGLVVTLGGVAMLSRPAAVILTGLALVLGALFAPQPGKKKTGE